MKTLVGITNYGHDHDDYLKQLLAEYAAMPDTDVVVFSECEKNLPAEVIVGNPGPLAWNLPFAHKQTFAERSDYYDFFLYSEDDHLITANTMTWWKWANGLLWGNKVIPGNNVAGFLQFEVGANGKNFPSIHASYRWDEAAAADGEIFGHLTNDHSACYMLNREQLEFCIASGKYLVEPHCTPGFAYGASAATDPYRQCGLKRWICISKLDHFLVHHLPNKYVGMLGCSQSELDQQLAKLRG